MMNKKWLSLIDDLSHADKLICPNCGQKQVDYIYVGDDTSKIGYLQIWCKACRKGIYISRVRIPPNVKFVSFEDSKRMEMPSYELL